MVTMSASFESWDEMENGSCQGSKTRSRVEILRKPSVCSRCHIFSPILAKLGQNVCINEFENGSFWTKNPLTHSHTMTPFKPLGNKPFENAVGKGEIARNEQYLLFPQCFLPVWINFFHFCQI